MGCKSTPTKIGEAPFQTVSKGVLLGDGIEKISETNLSISNAKDWKAFLDNIRVPNSFSKIAIDFARSSPSTLVVKISICSNERLIPRFNIFF